MSKSSKAISRSRTDRKGSRRESADARNADWAKMTPEKQLADLDIRLGKGVGAEKQRAKIQTKIESSKQKKQKVESTQEVAHVEPNVSKPKENKERQTRKKS